MTKLHDGDMLVPQKNTLMLTMGRIGHGVQTHWKTVTAAMTVFLVVMLRFCWPKLRRKDVYDPVDYKDGVVYIHMFPRRFTKKVVNLSPYAIKVETWCRMNKVPHQVVETTKFSKEGQIPWIRYNDKVLSESTVIIEFLQEEFHRSDSLSETQQAVARAVGRMMDDNFALLYFLYRYSMKLDEFSKYFRVTTAPKLLQGFIVRQIGKGMVKRGQLNGYGRYGEDHVINLGKKDLQALNGILGDKQYLMGDTPTTLDATAFSHLSQILYPDLSYPWKEYVQTDCPQLVDYCDRIKNAYWPDWDSLVDHDTFQ